MYIIRVHRSSVRHLLCTHLIAGFVALISANVVQATPKLTPRLAQAYRYQIEAERTNALDRLIAISDHISRADLLQSLARLRISEVKSFITDHLKHQDLSTRRVAYFGLSNLSFVNPRDWVPSQLSSLHKLAHQDRIALCDALSYSLHPSAGEYIFTIATQHKDSLTTEERDERLENNTLDHCLSAALAIAHTGHRVKITTEQAQEISNLNPLSPSGERALSLISQLVIAPDLLAGGDRDVILPFFRGVLRELSSSTEISLSRYSLTSLSASELLSKIAPWWGVGQLSSTPHPQIVSPKLRDLRRYRSADIMGEEESAPLSPIIIQKWLDSIEQAISADLRRGVIISLEERLQRREVNPFLKLIRALLRQKRLPKTLAREARRGLRLVEQIEKSFQSSAMTKDRVLFSHLKCHLSALIDHSVRRLRTLPRCLESEFDRPLVYQLSRRIMEHWGSHQQTKALQSLYRLHQSKRSREDLGREQLTETLVTLSPLGRRREWQLNKIKDALNGDSLNTQIAIEAITEHRLSRLQADVSDRVTLALSRDEYAVITVGIKCLEVLNPLSLKIFLPTLTAHHYPELRLLGRALETRYPHLIVAAAEQAKDPTQAASPLTENPLIGWGEKPKAEYLIIKLDRGTLKFRLAPKAFNSIKTLELAVSQGLFETGVVSQRSENRITFSAKVQRPWSAWIYPPRSEADHSLNPLALHDRWVLTWDPLIYDHYRTGWVLSRSADALSLIKHGVIAELISGGEILESLILGDQSIEAELK